MPEKECLFFKHLKGGSVSCLACSQYCTINEGGFGICKVRKNIKGKLYLMVYGKIAAENVDPIEKKPLYHFLPKTSAYSVGTIGCNFKCSFCQNYEISQDSDTSAGIDMSPMQIVKNALSNKCKSIAYTYNEPAIAIEYWMDAMKLAKKKGIKNVFVTNGYISKEALKKTGTLIDAINIDLKSFSNEFYQKICKAKLNPVLDTIRLAKKMGIWIEITTMIIPGKNDSQQEIEKIRDFIAGIDDNIPLHLSRYFPMYKMKTPPTPASSLEKSYDIAKKRLKHVYLGNLGETNDTICPDCGEIIIKRIGHLPIVKMKKNRCPKCGKTIKGVF